ncbi:MAG TPA: hypothetical protein VMU45_13735 [Candidatus Eisenbacteria bacterium]|nr:hypothetical protein [Candidatus Eisenbacteria bacterium]
MTEEVLHRQERILVRRQILDPGDATPWHQDVCQRVSVVLRGAELDIEFRDGSPSQRVEVSAGQVDWEMPSDRLHRAVNVGAVPYEEVTVFFLDHPKAIPQPEAV